MPGKKKRTAKDAPATSPEKQLPVSPPRQHNVQNTEKRGLGKCKLILIFLLGVATAVAGVYLKVTEKVDDPILSWGRRTADERREMIAKLQSLNPAGFGVRRLLAHHNDMEVGEEWLSENGHLTHYTNDLQLTCTNIPDHFKCDGVCDCCDGLDEQNCGHPTVSCGNSTCSDNLEWRTAVVRDRLNSIKAALQFKKIKYNSTLIGWSNLQADLQQSHKALGEKIAYFNNLIEEQATPEDQLQYMRHQLMEEDHKVRMMASITEDILQPDLNLFPLVTQCYEIEANERHYKGGCAEPDAKDFKFVVCPFRRITQQELPEDESKPPTLLGSFSGWDDASTMTASYGHSGPVRSQVFTGGAPCYQGPDREVHLAFECGVGTGIDRLYENGKCIYEVVMTSPFVCTYADLYKQQQKLRELHEMARK